MKFGAALVLAVALAAPVAAKDNQFLITPYLWISSVESRVATPIGTVTTEASFGDIMSNFDFGFMAGMEFRRGRIGLLGDIVYTNLGTSKATPGIGPFTNVDGRLKQTLFGGYVAWRAGEMSMADIDLLGGFRLYSVDTSVTLEKDGQEGPSFGVDPTWVDPVVGVRVALHLSDRWTATGLVDVGGFGVGSDISWQGLAKFSYRFSSSVSGEVGYRHLYYDRPGMKAGLAQSFSGPLLGVTIGF